MPLSALDFIQPIGEFAPHLFPLTDAEADVYADEAEKLEALLVAWIGQAEVADPTDETAQALYVTWKARASIYSTMAQSPLRAAVEKEGSFGYDYRQIADAKGERDAARKAYEDHGLAVVTLARPNSTVLAKRVLW